MAGITWDAIYQAIRDAIPPSEVVYGKVIKVDSNLRRIWIKEFGDQPIPIVGFTYTVKYYDETSANENTGSVGDPIKSHTKVKKVKKILPDMPEIGQTAVVLRQFGSGRLPKCVGVVLSPGGFQAIQ